MFLTGPRWGEMKSMMKGPFSKLPVAGRRKSTPGNQVSMKSETLWLGKKLASSSS